MRSFRYNSFQLFSVLFDYKPVLKCNFFRYLAKCLRDSKTIKKSKNNFLDCMSTVTIIVALGIIYFNPFMKEAVFYMITASVMKGLKYFVITFSHTL